MILPNAATLRTLVHHYYVREPIDDSGTTRDALEWLVSRGLAVRNTLANSYNLTPLGLAHVRQLLSIEVPTIETRFIGHDGKAIES